MDADISQQIKWVVCNRWTGLVDWTVGLTLYTKNHYALKWIMPIITGLDCGLDCCQTAWITGLLDLIFFISHDLHSIMQMCRGFLFLLCCSFSATGVVILTTKLLKPLIDDCMQYKQKAGVIVFFLRACDIFAPGASGLRIQPPTWTCGTRMGSLAFTPMFADTGDFASHQ